MRSDLTSGPLAPRGEDPARSAHQDPPAGADPVSRLTDGFGTAVPRVRLAFSDGTALGPVGARGKSATRGTGG